MTADVLVDAVSSLGRADDFVGHIGGDDFLAIVGTPRAEVICKRVIQEFDARIPGHYSEEDRRRGHIVAANRQGQETETPVTSISIAVIRSSGGKLQHVAELSHRAADLKKYVKGLTGSNYAVDRRTEAVTGSEFVPLAPPRRLTPRSKS
jgi:GGDEF domain-containing protein